MLYEKELQIGLFGLDFGNFKLFIDSVLDGGDILEKKKRRNFKLRS